MSAIWYGPTISDHLVKARSGNTRGAANTLQRTRRIAIDMGPEREGESPRDAIVEFLEAAGFSIVAHDGECELLAINNRLSE